MIHEEIKRIAEGLGMSYIFNDLSRVNYQIDDNTRYPILTDILPMSGGVGLSSPHGKETENCMVGIFVPCDLDFEGVEIHPQIEEVKSLFKNFILQLQASSVVTLESTNINYAVSYDKFNENCIGVMAEFSLSTTLIYC